ncbi:MAG TPA: Ig-like domain-containing protein, partial [Gemmatimonadales bacterium]|nr:Ig-like domain-containing protein [Gemmatimonadales bacterium]
MRRVLLAGGVLLAASCGGGGSTSPPPPPPPPNQPGPPASLTIQAGDGQEAAPGASVAIAPAVLVKDAQGRPVPGVAVRFAVDSGGGQVANATVQSDAQGVASAGGWTLGSAEGPNVLSVSVDGVAPLRIRATAKLTTVVLADQTLPASGGTISYSRSGDPLDGFSLTVPAGAYATAQQWHVESKPSLRANLPADLSQIGGGIVVGNDQDYSDSLIVLR